MNSKKNTPTIAFSSLAILFLLTIAQIISLKGMFPYKDVYMQFGGTMPLLTLFYIGISDFIRFRGGMANSLIVIFFTISVMLILRIKNKLILTKIYSILSAILLVSILLTSLAVRLPIMKYKKMSQEYNMSAEEVDKKVKEILEKYK